MTLQELNALLEAATPGEWVAIGRRSDDEWRIGVADQDCALQAPHGDMYGRDALLIVALHNAAPKLLKVAEAAKEVLDWCYYANRDGAAIGRLQQALKELEK